jgi:hypothetical protein
MFEESREKLKAAIKKVGEQIATIGKMEAAAKTADETAIQARADLAMYSSLDKEITKWRVDQVKHGASTKTLPDKLKAKLEAKRAAEEEITQSEATRDAINLELKEVREVIKPLEREQFECAVSLLHEKGDVLAQELIAVNQREIVLQQLLEGLSSMTVDFRDNRGERNIGRTKAMEEALSDHTWKFDRVNPYEGMGRRWKERLDALLVDPDADVTIPNPILPSDYTIEFKESRWGGFDLVAYLKAEN